MKVKAEDLKTGQLIYHQGYKLSITKKRIGFYKNGRKKIDLEGSAYGVPWEVNITVKADTLINIIDHVH